MQAEVASEPHSAESPPHKRPRRDVEVELSSSAQHDATKTVVEAPHSEAQPSPVEEKSNSFEIAKGVASVVISFTQREVEVMKNEMSNLEEKFDSSENALNQARCIIEKLVASSRTLLELVTKREEENKVLLAENAKLTGETARLCTDWVSTHMRAAATAGESPIRTAVGAGDQNVVKEKNISIEHWRNPPSDRGEIIKGRGLWELDPPLSPRRQ